MLKKYLNILSKIKPSYRYSNYKKLKKKIIIFLKKKFNNKYHKIELDDKLKFYHPKINFGNITSLNLLEIDELLIFKYYIKNSKLYDQFIDIGANIGVHSIINAKLGLKVLAFEPDPWHIKLLKRNIKKNKLKNIKIYDAAVSDKDTKSSFTRVLGNTTGSHITGAKKHVYNSIEKFDVKILSAKKLIKKNCLVKIDAEGEESKILNSLSREQLKNNDFICEIGNKKNAKKIFSKLKKEKICAYSQKINFKMVNKLADLPISYKEGSLFISSKFIWSI